MNKKYEILNSKSDDDCTIFYILYIVKSLLFKLKIFEKTILLVLCKRYSFSHILNNYLLLPLLNCWIFHFLFNFFLAVFSFL